MGNVILFDETNLGCIWG